jgi:hypothetical protein
MGVGTENVFGPSKHSPQSQLSENINAKLRTGWRNTHETIQEIFAADKCDINTDLLNQITATFFILNHKILFHVLSYFFLRLGSVFLFNVTFLSPVGYFL